MVPQGVAAQGRPSTTTLAVMEAPSAPAGSSTDAARSQDVEFIFSGNLLDATDDPSKQLWLYRVLTLEEGGPANLRQPPADFARRSKQSLREEILVAVVIAGIKHCFLAHNRFH